MLWAAIVVLLVWGGGVSWKAWKESARADTATDRVTNLETSLRQSNQANQNNIRQFEMTLKVANDHIRSYQLANAQLSRQVTELAEHINRLAGRQHYTWSYNTTWTRTPPSSPPPPRNGCGRCMDRDPNTSKPFSPGQTSGEHGGELLDTVTGRTWVPCDCRWGWRPKR